MSLQPFRPPPLFGHSTIFPAAEFECSVFSDPELIELEAAWRRRNGLSVADLKMTVGKWRFRSRYQHQVHHNEQLKLAVKAALEEIIWRARVLGPFDPDRPAFLGYATVPGVPSFPMRTYLVLEIFPHNFALVPRCDGPLLSHRQRERFGEDVSYANSFSAATRRWVQDFGAFISRGWDEVVQPNFNIVTVDSDTDESSLPLPVPSQLVEAVLESSQDSVGSAGSDAAVQGSPPGSPPSALPAAAQVAVREMLAILQQPLSPVGVPAEAAEVPLPGDQVDFVEE